MGLNLFLPADCTHCDNCHNCRYLRARNPKEKTRRVASQYLRILDIPSILSIKLVAYMTFEGAEFFFIFSTTKFYEEKILKN
jgi:hypothetical protein